MNKLILCAALFGLAPLSLSAGSLTLFATGEDLATDGFRTPELTRDGWELEFSRVIAKFDQITAWRTDPPFMADSSQIEGTPLSFGGPFTVDLANAEHSGRVELGTLDAPPGHYNALSWVLVPGEEGYSLLLQGVARKDGKEVPFTLRSTDRVAHACGEYLGEERKGFVIDTAGPEGGADLEITLHLDHIFGRADKDAQDEMNLTALGFDAFAAGEFQDIPLAGLHLGHVGEGHCYVTAQ